MAGDGMLNHAFIATTVTAGDRWCASHGATPEGTDLGAGILYYALAYATRAKTCVCLGSGGGFVPRMMRQAQRDLGLEDGRTMLVDGAHHVTSERKDVWGSPSWLEDDATFRSNYPDIEIILSLTEDACRDVFRARQIAIDYLHIDADHHYDGVKRDWDLFHPLVTPTGVITLHDTANYRDPCGVPQLVEEIRATGTYEVVDLPIAYGTAVVKRVLDPDENLAASRSSLSAQSGRR
jgi:hypothetical protein